MHKTHHGEIVLDEDDICDIMMQGHNVLALDNVTIDRDIDIQQIIPQMENPGSLITWGFAEDQDLSTPDFDRRRQSTWFMPEHYRDMDIAEHVLTLCETTEQLQRAGEELLLYQERDMLDLLRYLKYLVDTMRENRVIWGVGRGSSVSSYVLYLLGVHRIDSMFYDLDIKEFLR